MIKKIIIFIQFIICSFSFSQENEQIYYDYPMDYYSYTSVDTQNKEALKKKNEIKKIVDNNDLLVLLERKERMYLLERDIKGDKFNKVEIKYDNNEKTDK